MLMSNLCGRLVWRLMNEETGGEGSSSAGVVSEGGVPEQAGAAEPAIVESDETVNWASVDDEIEALDVEGDLEVVQPVAETPPVVETPATPISPTPTEETPAQTPPAATTEPLPTPVQAPSATPEEYATWRANRLTQLEGDYALDEASAAALLTEPETVLPKLAAKVHMEVLENAMRAVQAMVPVVVQQLNQHNDLNSKAKNLFTSVNPDLADPKFEPAIMQFGQVYRKVNPSSPPDEAARAIGSLVRAALGIAAPAASAPGPAVAPVQAPVPFTPARGAGGASAPPVSMNPFEQLAAEFLKDD